MTPAIETQILNRIGQLSNRMASLEKAVKMHVVTDSWLTQKFIKEHYDLSAKTLYMMRKDGSIKPSEWRSSGRKFQYSKKAIERIYK